ncbi:MAG: type II secretion system protein [Candidatus Curtissbacteria bacterium]|nr:type II secretion system protein [Candidatus Curtissbacteria bacterium]
MPFHKVNSKWKIVNRNKKSIRHLPFTIQVKVKRGFTLLELIIAVAVMGILAAAVIVSINPNKRQNQARDATIKNDIGQIASGLQSYFTSGTVGTYPGSLLALTTSSDLKSIPTPPAPGSGVYTYAPAVDGGGGVCDGISTFCTYARVSYPLFDPLTTGDVWCWQSSIGKGRETAVAACTP